MAIIIIPQDIKKNLAVIGLDEYKNRIECVDAWISDADNTAEKFDFVIERVPDGLYLHRAVSDNNNKNGFITTYDSVNEKAALQALARLVSKEYFIKLDWYDIMWITAPTTKYLTQTFSLYSCVADACEWIKTIGAQTDIDRNCIFLVHGCIGTPEVAEIAEALSDVFKGKNILGGLITAEDTETDVCLSLWLNNF